MSGYVMDKPGLGITLEVDRLRRDRHELIGELIVKCSLEGARSVNGCLSTGDFNFSSVRARQERAKLLHQRSNTNGSVDWFSLLEEFSQGVFQAERTGDPAVNLRTVARPKPDDEIILPGGLRFPRRHGSIVFGNGGTSKSLLALYLAGEMNRLGMHPCFCDWELDEGDHRARLEQLFGTHMPDVFYIRCQRPLTIEVDRIERVVRQHSIDYVIYDSIVFACDGPPESAETAARYFRAVREIGVGSLSIAHVTKNGEDNDKQPFGSAFWHNGARSTWNIQAAEPDALGSFQIALHHRKANLGPIRRPVSYMVKFENDRTEFQATDIHKSPTLAGKLSIGKRLAAVLKRGPQNIETLAEALGERPDTVRRTVQRLTDVFIKLQDGRYALLQKI